MDQSKNKIVRTIFLFLWCFSNALAQTITVDWADLTPGDRPASGSGQIFALLNEEDPNLVQVTDQATIPSNPLLSSKRAMHITAAGEDAKARPRMILDFLNGNPTLKGRVRMELFIYSTEAAGAAVQLVLAPYAVADPANAMLAENAVLISLRSLPTQVGIPATAESRISCLPRAKINEINTLEIEWDFTTAEPHLSLKLNDELVQAVAPEQNQVFGQFLLPTSVHSGFGAMMIIAGSKNSRTEYAVGEIEFRSDQP